MKYSKELHNQLRKRDKDSDSDYVQCLLDEIERLQALSRWIPVSEGLPETNKEVLTLDERGLCQVAGHYPDGNWYQRGIGLVWRTVTHWMPLPEPPEDK